MKLPSMRATEDQNYTPEMNIMDFFFEGFLLYMDSHTLQMFAGIYGESTFRTCKNDRETLYRGKPQ